MQTLPPEVFFGLLEYLPYRDRKSLSETSAYFNRLCLDRKYLDKEQIVFEGCVLSPEISPLDVLLKSERTFSNIKCTNLEIYNKSDIFWRRFGPYIKTLHLRSCSIALNYVSCFFSYLENLEYLELDECRDLFMSGTMFSKPDDLLKVGDALKNVKELVVNEQNYLSDALFNRLVTCMPNLNNLSLHGCYINFHEAVYKRYYRKDNVELGSDSVLTFRFILSYLQKASRFLKKLDFSWTKLDNSCLKKIALLDGLNLTEICLHGCSQLTNGSLIDLVNCQKDLLVIDIGSCVRLTDKALIAISDGLPTLKELNISGCSGITYLGLESLAKLTYLNKLTVIYSGSTYKKEIFSLSSKTIKFLDLRSSNFNDLALITLISDLSNLVYLDLGHCTNSVSNLSLHAIFRNCQRLQHLKLRACPRITNYGLCEKIENEQAQALSNSDDGQFGDVVIGTRSCSLLDLKGLKTLHLGFCFKITDITLHHGIKFLELRDLDLSCCNITDDGLRVLSENNPSIEELNLSGCHTITDEGLKSLQNLHRLRRLSLKNVKQITADGVLTMKRNCKSLQYLDASQCDLNLGEMDLGSSTSLNSEGFLYFQPQGTFPNSCPRWQNDTLIHQSDSPSSIES